MTWGEIFARLRLVFRSRFRRFHMCPQCGEPMTIYAEDITGAWQCPDCGHCERRSIRCGAGYISTLPRVPSPVTRFGPQPPRPPRGGMAQSDAPR
jgi:ribosomal protein L37AE/L43A